MSLRHFGSYVIEHILFKVEYPAEFHAQTAVEAACRLHEQSRGRIEVARIVDRNAGVRPPDHRQAGPLHNPADRDHCLQYMVAVGLLEGTLTADHYQDAYACDPHIDRLREKMEVAENPRYSREYLDPEKRSIANAVQVFFDDGTATERIEVEYPLGHQRRRVESLPHLDRKFQANLASCLPARQCQAVVQSFRDPQRLEAMAANQLLAARAGERVRTPSANWLPILVCRERTPCRSRCGTGFASVSPRKALAEPVPHDRSEVANLSAACTA